MAIKTFRLSGLATIATRFDRRAECPLRSNLAKAAGALTVDGARLLLLSADERRSNIAIARFAKTA
jgi:hypothetical protein